VELTYIARDCRMIQVALRVLLKKSKGFEVNGSLELRMGFRGNSTDG